MLKKGFLDNSVNQSRFSAVSVHLEILLTISNVFLHFIYFIKISKDFTENSLT